MPSSSGNSSVLLESGTNEVELIEFYLGKESYAVNVSKVLRVIAKNDMQVTPLAESHPCIAGITHIQDTPVPVINLRDALSIKDEPKHPDRQLLLVLQFNNNIVSYIIDGINKIHRTNWKNFKPVSQGSTGSKGFINGTVRIEDHVILFLDVEHLQQSIAPHQEESHYDRYIPDPAHAEKRGKLKVLYVEDSPTIRKQTASELSTAGFTQLHVVENGLRALEYVKQLQKRSEEHKGSLKDYLDIVITDVEMPEMDGLTLCKTLKTQLPKNEAPEVIVYSSLINDQMKRKCEAVKADAAICKPQIDKIIKRIDQDYFIG